MDEKGRVIIPAKLRPALTDQFWMMLDENDNIAIYNLQTGLDILKHCEQMIAEDPENEAVAAAVERITGAADLVVVENGYRVPVPEILRYRSGLEKEVVTVGVLNHAVIWSRAKWEAAEEERLHSPEIRKAQASMLRAAASSVKRKAEQKEGRGAEPARAEDEEETLAARAPAAAAVASGAGGEREAATGTEGRVGRKAAPAGDGARSPRVLALSQLGR
jgi:division/cell wall cluster transcriptional repressor MraZ